MLFSHISLILERLTLAEYHEQEEIFKLRLGHLKKVCPMLNLQQQFIKAFFHLSGGEFVFLCSTGAGPYVLINFISHSLYPGPSV